MNIETLLQQCPSGTSKEHVEKLLKKHDNDTSCVLSECWNLSETKSTESNDCQKKWKNIRDICNSYEEEMKQFMNKSS
jgi:hypothetical protein